MFNLLRGFTGVPLQWQTTSGNHPARDEHALMTKASELDMAAFNPSYPGYGPGVETDITSGAFYGSAVNYPFSRKPKQATFGSLQPDLGRGTQIAHDLYQVIAGDPGRRIIVMDLLGWCGLRTLIDYYREFFYARNIGSLFGGNKNKSTDNSVQATKINANPAAASERILRETLATIGDVAIAGPVIAHLTNITDQMSHLYTGNFIDQRFLAYCQDKVKQLIKKSSRVNHVLHPQDMLEQLFASIAADVSKNHPLETQREIAKILRPTYFREHSQPVRTGFQKFYTWVFGGTNRSLNVNELDKLLVGLMDKPGDHTIKINGWETQLSDLLTNMYKLQEKTTSHGPVSLETFATRLIKSQKIRQKLPLILGGVFLLNLVVPHLIQKNTQKKFGISQYPGEVGLLHHSQFGNSNNSDHQAHWYNRVFPFLSTALKHGNIMPLLSAALFLPFVFGLYRIGKRPVPFDIPKSFHWEDLKKYGSEWLEKHDFAKSFPWSSDQQQATSYAATLFSRILTARSPIEFRERLFDSALSYTAAFELTPLLQSKVAKCLSAAKGVGAQLRKLVGLEKVDLFKLNGDLRTEAEILSLTDAQARKDSLTAKVWLDWLMFGGTTLVMGVFEPILSILLTSLQADYLNRRYDRRMRNQASNFSYGQTPKLADRSAIFQAFNQG